MACQGLTFVPQNCSAWILGRLEEQIIDILASIQGLSPLLNGLATSLEEVSDWLQFAYTADRTGDYVSPLSAFLVHSAVVEEDKHFPAFYRHLLKIYLGAYDPSLIGPGPDHPVAPTCQAPERRDSQRGEERG